MGVNSKPSEVYIVVNIHLQFSQNGQHNFRAYPNRLYQILRILKMIDELQQKYVRENLKKPTVIIMGDTNTNLNKHGTDEKYPTELEDLLYDGVTYWTTTTGEKLEIISPTRLKFFQPGYIFKNIYTRHTDVEKAKVDGIFVSKNLPTHKVSFLQELTAYQKVPNLRNPSDHIPQAIDITSNVD